MFDYISFHLKFFDVDVVLQVSSPFLSFFELCVNIKSDAKHIL